MKRGGPLKRTTEMKRSSGLRPRSKRMAETYSKPGGRRDLVARMLTDKPWCEVRIEDICDGASVDVHELLARSAGGSITDESNCVCVCRRCHDWINTHPKEARARGLRLSRYAGRNP